MKTFLILVGLTLLGVTNVKASIGSAIRKAGEALFDVNHQFSHLFQEVSGSPIEPEELTFALYTKDSKIHGINVTHDDYKSVANKEGRIYFIIHGYRQSKNVQWYYDLRKALLKKEPNAFVVEVDWHVPARQAYPFATYNTEDIGELIGTLIYNIHSNHNVPLKNFVLIGFSSGGHIAGWAGKKVKLLTQGEKIGRIIALDPAGPLFNFRVETRRLSRHDAHVVHVIHTDGNKCGFTLPLGTIDFFPNGGMDQLGCLKHNFRENSITSWTPEYCDHSRSHEYLIEGINSEDSFKSKKCANFMKFQANLCDDVVVSMSDLYTVKEGNFFLSTNAVKPYSKPLSHTTRRLNTL